MSLPIGTQHDPAAPWNETGNWNVCKCCGEPFDEEDPCIIDGHVFCDHCASDVMQLRFDGYIEEVSVKTKKLAE